MKFKKLLTIFIFLLFYVNILDAKSEYIKLTTTVSKVKLYKLKSKLNKYGYKTYLTSNKTGYTLYSGPYSGLYKANKILKKLKRSFPSAYIVGTKKASTQQKDIKKVTKKEKIEEENEEVNDTALDSSEDEDSSFFISASLGYSLINSSLSGTSSFSSPSSGAISYGIEAGFNQNENLFYTFGYSDSNNNDIDISYISLSANYNINYFKQVPIYVGVLTSYSTLIWAGATSTSLNFGTQLGTIYKLSSTYYLFTSYQYQTLTHTTNIDNGASSLKQDSMHNLNFGLRYNF